MKITINNYGNTYSVESNDDHDIESVANMFKGLLVSVGYHPSNVDELFPTESKWFAKKETNSNEERVEDYLNNLYKSEDDDDIFS
jgi:Tat protein secretion system quality control protein TatD with DNase activity